MSASLRTNLSSHWKLDDTAADAHGVNTLTLTGSPAYATGKINNGLALVRASSQYASVADVATLEPGGAFSIYAWVKLSSATTGAAYTIASKGTSTGNQRCFVFKVNDAGTMALQASSAGSAFNGDTSVSWTEVTGAFVFFVVTFNAGSVKYYVNGSQQGTTQTSAISTLFNSTGSFGIGASNRSGTPDDFMDGVVDEVGFLQRELSASEVSQLYGGGSGFQYPFSLGSFADVAGAPVDAGSIKGKISASEVAGAPVESNRFKYGFQNQTKNSATWTNQSKS